MCEVVFSINSYVHLCQIPFPWGLILLLLIAFERAEVALLGGKEEERQGKCRKALPDSVVSVSLFLLLAWKEPVCFHQVNRGKKNPIKSSDVGTGA